jgi:hypothetical protein
MQPYHLWRGININNKFWHECLACYGSMRDNKAQIWLHIYHGFVHFVHFLIFCLEVVELFVWQCSNAFKQRICIHMGLQHFEVKSSLKLPNRNRSSSNTPMWRLMLGSFCFFGESWLVSILTLCYKNLIGLYIYNSVGENWPSYQDF